MRDALTPGHRLPWAPELGLSLLIALGQLLLIDLTEFQLPPAGRAMQSGLASLAVLLIALHRLLPSLSAHEVIATAVLLATATAGVEWMLARRPTITPRS